MDKNPQIEGPSELLILAEEQLGKDDEPHRRLAFICADAAIELMLKIFLALPDDSTGNPIKVERYRKAARQFPELLSAVETHAAGKLTGISLREIGNFHDLRNQLYHFGAGVSVSEDMVRYYCSISKVLYRALFDLEMKAAETEPQARFEMFMRSWIEIEILLKELTWRLVSPDEYSYRGTISASDVLVVKGHLDRATAHTIRILREARNAVAHGSRDFAELFTDNTVRQAIEIARFLHKMLSELPE